MNASAEQLYMQFGELEQTLIKYIVKAVFHIKLPRDHMCLCYLTTSTLFNSRWRTMYRFCVVFQRHTSLKKTKKYCLSTKQLKRDSNRKLSWSFRATHLQYPTLAKKRFPLYSSTSIARLPSTRKLCWSWSCDLRCTSRIWHFSGSTSLCAAEPHVIQRYELCRTCSCRCLRSHEQMVAENSQLKQLQVRDHYPDSFTGTVFTAA